MCAPTPLRWPGCPGLAWSLTSFLGLCRCRCRSRFSSLSSLLSHKLCLILLHLTSPSPLRLFAFHFCNSKLCFKFCTWHSRSLSVSLSRSSLRNSNVDCDCGSHFNALLFVFVAAAAAAATAGSSASFSFYFPVSAAQIPSPVCTRFVIAFNKNSCCSLLVSPSNPTPSSPLLHSLPLLYVYYCVAALPSPRLIFK